MKSMIYYPGFELKSEKWLKFALLYFDELRPIIPHMAVPDNQYLSPSALKVMSETNLFHPYYPDLSDSTLASTIACNEFDNFLKHPERYFTMFNHSRPKDLQSIWNNSNSHLCNLYYGKFSDVFFKYCLDNKLATEFDYGIRLPKELAFIYMSYLADVISKKEQIDMFTDESRYNSLLRKNDCCISKDKDLKIKLVKAQIETPFPSDFNNIPLAEFIKLRSSKSFEECRIEFVKQIDDFIKKREENYNLSMNNILNPSKDIFHLLSASFGALGTLFLTSTSIVSLATEQPSIPYVFASVFSGIPTINEIRNAPIYFNKMRSKIQARRYLARVRNLYDSQKRR